jgi:hypothetical protein
VGRELEIHICDNCRWKGMDPLPVKDLEKRIEPGGLVPSGECPTCGCLCYPIYGDVTFLEFDKDGTITEISGPPWMNFVTIDPRLEDDPELMVQMRARRKLLRNALESGRVVGYLKSQGDSASGETVNTYHKDPSKR